MYSSAQQGPRCEGSRHAGTRPRGLRSRTRCSGQREIVIPPAECNFAPRSAGSICCDFVVRVAGRADQAQLRRQSVARFESSPAPGDAYPAWLSDLDRGSYASWDARYGAILCAVPPVLFPCDATVKSGDAGGPGDPADGERIGEEAIAWFLPERRGRRIRPPRRTRVAVIIGIGGRGTTSAIADERG